MLGSHTACDVTGRRLKAGPTTREGNAMRDGAPNPIETRMLRMLRHPDVSAAMLDDAMDDPPRQFRHVVLEQIEARVLNELPPGEQRRYWAQIAAMDSRDRDGYRRQAWRYARLKAWVAGMRESSSG